MSDDREVVSAIVCERGDGKWFLLGLRKGRLGYDVVVDPDESGKRVCLYDTAEEADKRLQELGW